MISQKVYGTMHLFVVELVVNMMNVYLTRQPGVQCRLFIIKFTCKRMGSQLGGKSIVECDSSSSGLLKAEQIVA